MPSLWSLRFSVLLLLMFPWVALTQTQPHLPRIGANLAPNSPLAGSTGWLPSAGGVYDSAVTRTADGSGSVRLPPSGRVDLSGSIAVTPGKTYIFAFYMRTNTFPPGSVDVGMSEMNASGTVIANMETGLVGNSAPNIWEETVMNYTAGPSAASVGLTITRFYGDSSPQPLWVDDLYFGEGVGFQQPPTAKIPFPGVDVKVDALGNMDVLKAGVYQPFFPLCVYSDNARSGYGAQLYSDQGFNCDVWGGHWDSINYFASAVSTFNPNGMMAGLDTTNTSWSGAPSWDAAGANIHNWSEAVKATGKFHTHLLWYYLDNEGVFNQWDNHMTYMTQWKTEDTIGGQRHHPFYGLNGMPEFPRIYHDPATGRRGFDIVGTYMGGFSNGPEYIASRQIIQQNLQGQDFPVVVAQVNIATVGQPPGNLRQLTYKYLNGGAKGIGIWRDCILNRCGGDATDITTVGWWPDVPNLRRELDAMLPLIRQPHWTTWTVTLNTPALDLSIGTRDYNGKGHITLSNASTSPITRTFTVTGLGYTPTSIVDYFTGTTVTTFSGNSFTVSLPGSGINSGTAVYRIEGAGTGVNVPVINSALSVVGNVGGPFLYQISATNSPTSYGATPLPAGLSVNTGTGLISGTPTGAGTTSVTISATNAGGTGIASLNLSVSPALAPQLLLHWPFDDGTGTTARDATGHGYTGTLVGAPTWGIPGLTFDGATQYVTTTTLPWPANQPATFALWVNTAGGTVGGAFGVGGTEERAGAHIPWLDNILYFDWGMRNANGGISADFASYLNTWTHVALLSNGTNFKAIYINGQLVTSATVAGAPTVALTGVEVGRYKIGNLATYYWTGGIRDFRLYTYTLSAADILALYTGDTLPVPLNFRIAP